MSELWIVLPGTTRNVIIHATLWVASSGLTRANRVQGITPGAELDGPAFPVDLALTTTQRQTPMVG